MVDMTACGTEELTKGTMEECEGDEEEEEVEEDDDGEEDDVKVSLNC